MTRTMILGFNPQSEKDTTKTILYATSKVIENADDIYLKPDSSLISVECLKLLNDADYKLVHGTYGYLFKINTNK